MAVTPKSFPRGAQGRGSASFAVALLGGTGGSCGKSFGVSRVGLVFTSAKQNHVSRARLWFCLRGGAGRAGEGGKAARGRADAAGPWDAPWPALLFWHSKHRAVPLGEPPMRTWAPLPRVPSPGDVCTEVVSLGVPGATSGAELERGTLSFFPLLYAPAYCQKSRKRQQFNSDLGLFFLSTLPILGPVLPFRGWFDPAALAIPLQAPVRSASAPLGGVRHTDAIAGGHSIPKKKTCRELAISLGESVPRLSLCHPRPLRDQPSVLRAGPSVEPEAAAGGAAFLQPPEQLRHEPGWKLFNSCGVSHEEPGFQSSLAPM